MAVHVFELGEVEARGRASDMREIESSIISSRRKKFLVAVAPAEPHEIIAQRRGQKAHGAIGIDAERAMPLRQFGAVGAMDQRNMRHDRGAPAERLIDLHLARRIGQMIVAANDMRDAHVVIVDDDGEHIGRRAVGAQKDEIVEILVGPATRPCTLSSRTVSPSRGRLSRMTGFTPRRRFGGGAVAPAPVIARRASFGARLARASRRVLAGVA